MRIVVFGAGGATGHRVVEESLRAGHPTTAAVRDPAAFAPVTGADATLLTVVRADVRVLDDVRDAVEQHDAVVSTVGPAGRRARGLYSTAAATLTTAMGERGALRLVALSSSGVRRGDPHHPLWYRAVARTVLHELYTDMRRMERTLRDSPVDWTVVRPTRIVDTAPTGRCRVGDGGTPPGGRSVSRTDLARFVVAALHDGSWSHRYPTLAQ